MQRLNFMNEIPDAVIRDPRSKIEIEKDYLHESTYSGMPVVWVEKSEKDWKTASQRNQDGSFSCVKQSSATALEVLTKKIISAATYQLRKDKSQGGMFLQNCGDIDYNFGATYESTTPSQNVDDPTLDAIKLPLLTIKSTGYRTFYNHDIEKVAEAIQAYGQCILCFQSNSQEWQMKPQFLGTPTTFGHAICGIDFGLVNGVKTIICMDSAGQWSSANGVRLITEDFLNKRCTGAMYYLGAKVVDPNLSPLLSVSIWVQFVNLLKSIGTLAGDIVGDIIRINN